MRLDRRGSEEKANPTVGGYLKLALEYVALAVLAVPGLYIWLPFFLPEPEVDPAEVDPAVIEWTFWVVLVFGPMISFVAGLLALKALRRVWQVLRAAVVTLDFAAAAFMAAIQAAILWP